MCSLNAYKSDNKIENITAGLVEQKICRGTYSLLMKLDDYPERVYFCLKIKKK